MYICVVLYISYLLSLGSDVDFASMCSLAILASTNDDPVPPDPVVLKNGTQIYTGLV